MKSPVGINIKNLRALRSWTQEHLAEAAEVTSRTVQRAEAGEPIAAESLQAIAGALGASLDEVRRDQDEEKLQKLMAQFIRVGMQPLREGPELLQVMPVDALVIEANGPQLAVRHADAIATLRESLMDMIDLWPDVSEASHLEWVRGLQPTLLAISTLGAAVSLGAFDLAARGQPGQPAVKMRSLLIVIASESAPVAFVDRKKLAVTL